MKTFDVTLEVAGQYRGIAIDGTTKPHAGWAYKLTFGEHTKQESGKPDKLTDSAAVLTALLHGLQALKKPCNLKVVYAHKALNTLVETIQRGFVVRTGDLSANAEIIMEIAPLLAKHNVSFVKVDKSGVQGYARMACTEDEKK